MEYEGNVIRPPSEANSILLQVVVGCPHNACSFCGTYRDVKLRIKNLDEIRQDLEFAQAHCKRLRRIFLMDGDVLRLPQHRLIKIFELLHQYLPWANRIRLYGSAKSVLNKSLDELEELKSLGLDRIYLGLESGLEQTLTDINKGVTTIEMIEAGQKVRKAGLFLSVTVLLGIAGTTLSQEHARGTGQVLSAMEPSQIGVLTLMLLENTPLYRDYQEGKFELPDSLGLLAELRTMVQHINLKKVQFMANHASNYLPVNCRLGRDKEELLRTLDHAINGNIALKPEMLRAL